MHTKLLFKKTLIAMLNNPVSSLEPIAGWAQVRVTGRWRADLVDQRLG
jgi:hypothetical protein